MNQKRSWLWWGMVFGLIHLGVFFYCYCLYLSFPTVALTYLQGWALLIADAPVMGLLDFLPVNFFFLILAIFGSLQWFIIGLSFGLIYEKIKNKN